jgi:hypothetical protein
VTGDRGNEGRCRACYVALPADAPAWKTLCRECFVAAKKAEHAALLAERDELHLEVRRLRDVLEQRTALPTIDPQMVRTLLQLCHPDRHGNIHDQSR